MEKCLIELFGFFTAEGTLPARQFFFEPRLPGKLTGKRFTGAPVTPLQDSIDIVDRLSPEIVQFEVVPNTGHGPWRDNPEDTFAILEQFILSTQTA